MEDKKYTGKQVDPNEITRQYLDSILLEQRILDSDPRTGFLRPAGSL